MASRAKTNQGIPDPSLLDECARYSRWGIFVRQSRVRWLGGIWRVVLAINSLGKRCCDLTVSLLILGALSPALILFAILQRMTGRPVFASDARVGRWGVPFRLLELRADAPWGRWLAAVGFNRLPYLINVVRGDLSLIGPQPFRPDELKLHQRAVQKRSNIRPGLLSLWWLRKRANIDFTSELQVDLEYIDRQSLRGDVGIALRAIPALLYGSSSIEAPGTVVVLGVPFLNICMDEALEYILSAAHGDSPKQLCFVNTDCVNQAQVDRDYASLLKSADAVLADGIGIRIAGKLLRQDIRQNVNGTDLFPMLCEKLEGTGIGLYLLGGRPGVADAVRDWVEKKYPGTRICGLHHGYFDQDELPSLLPRIRSTGAQILLVAFGSPMQDKWIGEHLGQTGAKIAMGVGGLFDFYSGNIPRAPQWMRELSLEWMFRLIQEPSRMWKRYLVGNAVFLIRVVWWIVSSRRAQDLIVP